MLIRLKNQRGLSLLEIMIVLGIIAAATMTIMNVVFKNQDLANIDQAKAEMARMAGYVKLYKSKTGKYPDSSAGLQALVEQGYMEEVPQDPWKNDYIYQSPASGGQKFEICTNGPDSDEAAEPICNWTKDAPSE